MPNKIQGYNDPNHPGNSPKYRTKKLCIEDGCFRLAGTMWGPYWCFKHNVERIDRIDKALESMINEFSEGNEFDWFPADRPPKKIQITVEDI